MDHALLIAGLVEPEVFAVLQQGLADAGDVAVTEDADRATEEGLGVAVALDALGGEEPDDGLADGQPLGGVGLGTECPSAVKGWWAVGRDQLRVRVARDKGKSAVEADALPHILGGLRGRGPGKPAECAWPPARREH